MLVTVVNVRDGEPGCKLETCVLVTLVNARDGETGWSSICLLATSRGLYCLDTYLNTRLLPLSGCVYAVSNGTVVPHAGRASDIAPVCQPLPIRAHPSNRWHQSGTVLYTIADVCRMLCVRLFSGRVRIWVCGLCSRRQVLLADVGAAAVTHPVHSSESVHAAGGGLLYK